MIGWLIYSEYEAKRNQNYIDFYLEEGKKREIKFHLLIAERIEIGVKDSVWFLSYDGLAIKHPDFVICRIRYPLLTKQLEYMGIKTFNNSKISEIGNDKARTYQYVANANISIIDSVFCKKGFMKEKLETLSYPLIVKSTGGHGGTEVYLLEKREDISKVLSICQKEDVVIQPYISKSHQDLRVYVIGKKIIAAVLRTAKEDFRSNFCLGGDVRLYELSSREKEQIEKVIQLFDFGLVGIDFIIGDQGELLFNEIEDVVGSRMLYQCSNINIVDLYLEYIVNHL